MTKKIDSQDFAKQRMREYLKKKGINLVTAEQECGFKRGFLSAGGVVGSDKLSQFVETYPDVDLYYIITGHEDAFRLALNEKIQDIKELIKNVLETVNTVTNTVTKKSTHS